MKQLIWHIKSMIAKLEELYNEGIGPHDEAVVAAGIRMIEQNR